MDDMAKRIPGFFQRDDGYWYYRKRVPKDVQRFFKEREFWIALGTTDRSEAEIQFHLVATQQLKTYDELRKKHAAFRGEKNDDGNRYEAFKVDREEAITLAKAYLAECLNDPDSRKTERQLGKSAAHDIRAELSSDLWSLSKAEDGDDGQMLVSHSAKSMLARGGYELSSKQAISKDFLEVVRSTLIALRKIELDRLDANFRDDPENAELADFKSFSFDKIGRRKIEALTVGSAIDKLWKEQIEPERKAVKTVVKYKAAFKLLERFLGSDKPVREITRDQLVAYRDTLMRMPSNYSKKFSAGMDFPTIIAEAAEVKAPVMKFKTREAYISLMKRLFRWASVNDYMHKDISLDIPIGGKRIAGRNKRGSFEAVELNAIFSAPVFTGCVDDERNYAIPGPRRPRRSRFWLPLIALYTGMRMGEILQLRAEHVRRSPKGNPFFYLTDGFGEDDGDPDFIGIELKTSNSRREVPIHPILVEIGFLGFVADLERKGQSELFPDVPVAADGKKSTIFSKRFSRFLQKVGVKPDGNGNCFHMFRHTLRDAIRDCGISGEIADAVQGWARDEDEGRNYGRGYKVDAMADVWGQLHYEGFDHRHLVVNRDQ